MTKRKAERLTGYEIRRMESEGKNGRFRFGAFRGEENVAEGDHRIESWALWFLVRAVYVVHCGIVLERYGWRCSRCHEAKPLQIHHRCFRSHGGTHDLENLEPVCMDCHREIHRRERSR